MTIEPRVLGDDPLPAPWTSGPPRTWLLRIDDRPQPYAHTLDAQEQARAAAFARENLRTRYVASHLALRRLLGAYLGMEPGAVELTREPCPGCGGPHGRPAAVGARFHFNLSHAGDLAFIAFADTPVGADVEREQPAEVAAEVARMLHPDERAELAALAAAELPVAFARCWTRKEAYLKGLGTGLSESPTKTYVGTARTPSPPPGWTLTDIEVDHGYAAAIAVATG
ncbi:4'-phosphopantetheinyl transferase superfamily protein [Streptomyces sp. NPDC051162]|uniref:4'-phosphopantetheinyl transferase family protein n=1 Tax=Streptomyces sp. NPDC051162 TaxID=3154747 RepID=UPI0034440096